MSSIINIAANETTISIGTGNLKKLVNSTKNAAISTWRQSQFDPYFLEWIGATQCLHSDNGLCPKMAVSTWK
jgi:hypothetical protein